MVSVICTAISCSSSRSIVSWQVRSASNIPRLRTIVWHPFSSNSLMSDGWIPGTWWVSVSPQFHSRPPPGQSLKSLPIPTPSTSMRPQERCFIWGDRISSLFIKCLGCRFVQINPLIHRHALHQLTNQLVGNFVHFFQTDTTLTHIQLVFAVLWVFTNKPF